MNFKNPSVVHGMGYACIFSHARCSCTKRTWITNPSLTSKGFSDSLTIDYMLCLQLVLFSSRWNHSYSQTSDTIESVENKQGRAMNKTQIDTEDIHVNTFQTTYLMRWDKNSNPRQLAALTAVFASQVSLVLRCSKNGRWRRPLIRDYDDPCVLWLYDKINNW